MCSNDVLTSKLCLNIARLTIHQIAWNKASSIHVNPPRSSRSLPEMQPDSRTPGSETEPPGCENTKKKKKKKNFFFQTVIFAHMYDNNGHLLLEGN